MKNVIKKSVNVVFALALVLTLNATVVIPDVEIGDAGIAPMSDLDMAMEFFI